MGDNDMHMDSTPDGRVGFRDIYRAVTESEMRVTAAITAAVSPINAAVADHEVRLRGLEAGSAGIPAANRVAIELVREDVARMEEALSNAAAISGRRASDFSVAQKTLITIIVVSNFIIGLLIILSGMVDVSLVRP